MLYMLEQIVKIINDGYGIISAKKRVCGGVNNYKSKAVMAHPQYLHILNTYLKDRRYALSFVKFENQLRQKAPVKGLKHKQELHEEVS